MHMRSRFSALLFTVIRKNSGINKTQDKNTHISDHLFVTQDINLQLLFLNHFLFFGFSSYYLNFNFVINGTCVGQTDYIIFTISVVFNNGVRLFIRHTCAPCLGSNYSLMPSRCCRRCEAHFCHM